MNLRSGRKSGFNLIKEAKIKNVRGLSKAPYIFLQLSVDKLTQFSYNNTCVTKIAVATRCGSVWLEHLVWDQGVAGSNPVTSSSDYICRCGSMVEHQPSKLNTWVRFPSPASFFGPKFRPLQPFWFT